jgi:stringent starvation protein B
MPTQPPPPKKEVALALLERSSILVHLDPRLEPVAVPVWFKKQPQLVLQVGLNMPVPIPDLRLDDDGMSCTLSFNRAPFFCVVPWSSVFAMVGEDGRGMVWPDDVPADVARQAQVRPVEAPAPARKESAPRPVPGRERVAAKAAASDAPKPKRSRKRPALAAVPDGEAAAPTKTGTTARAASAPARPAVTPIGAPPARSNGAARGSSSKKRELPPYLRVVK